MRGRLAALQMGRGLLVAAVLVLSSGAEAAPIWLDKLDLSATGGSASRPQVAVSGDGTAIAVWRRSNGANLIVQTAIRPPGGPWGPPKDLSAPGQDGTNPQVATNARGDAVVVWHRSNGTNTIVQATVRPAGGGWSSPKDLSPLGRNASEAQVGIDDAGNAVAVWWHPDNDLQQTLQAAVRPSAGDWSGPIQLSFPTEDSNVPPPRMAMNAAGDTVAVWTRNDGSDYLVEAVLRPAGGVWGTPQRVSAVGEDSSAADVAIGPGGDAVATWHWIDSGVGTVQASVRPAGGSWGERKNVSVPGEGLPRAAIDADGNAIVVWRGGIGFTYVVRAAYRPAGGVWGAPQPLTSGGSAEDPQVAMDAAGNAVVVWRRWDGSNDIAQAAIRPPGGVFGAVKDLSAAGRNAAAPQVAVSGGGDGVAVWSRSNGTNTIVQGAGLDANGPVLDGLAIPAQGQQGKRLSFSVAPVDVWSALAGAPSWKFGDGKAAGGASVQHTYARAGRFTVSVTQVDVLGNESSATGVVTIAARCIVPSLRGKTVTKAKAALKGAHCRLGAVRSERSSRMRAGRVLEQKPRAGQNLPAGTRVKLVVSLGAR